VTSNNVQKKYYGNMSWLDCLWL